MAYLITWSWDHEITWQTKIISPLKQCLWPSNMVSWWLVIRGFHPQCYSKLWSRGLVRSRDKQKLLHLHYHSAYAHQMWQDDNLPWWAAANKVTCPYHHVVKFFWDYVTNQNHNFFTTTVSMATKFGEMVI